MDEPVADPAAITTYLICKAAKEKLTVMLSGMGGDEIFAGYPRHLASLYAEQYLKIPGILRTAVLEKLIHRVPIMGPLRARASVRNAKKFVKSASLPFIERYLGFGTYFTQEEKQDLYSREIINSLNGFNPYEKHMEYFRHVQDQHPINQMIYIDLKTFLPCLNLTYTDKMSMAASVEVRVPYLDDRLVELSGSVPQDLKLNGKVGKYILKKASSKLLPDEIIWRKKAGFGAPIGAWIKRDLKEMIMDLLSEKVVKERGYFNYSAIKQMLEDHYSGKTYSALQIWQLLTLEIWHRTFIDKDSWQT
jgi:asparagine synthase (glutamine-hydrolysing)